MCVKNKVLVVICTYNPSDVGYDNSFGDFTHYWFKAIESWKLQQNKNLAVDIIVSDNVSGPKTRSKLLEYQKISGGFSVDFINRYYSSQFIGFNHAIKKMGETYDYYIYSASDVSLKSKNDLEKLLGDMKSIPGCSMISPQADSDMIQRYDYNNREKSTKIRIGYGVNNHMAVFDCYFMKKYDFKYVDIMYGPCTEEFYPYLCAAIGRDEYLSHRVSIHHIGNQDRKHGNKKTIPYCSVLYKRQFYKMLEKGTAFGLGFGEVIRNINVFKNIFLNQPSWRNFKMLVFKFLTLNGVYKTDKDVMSIIGGICYYPHNPKKFDRDEHSLDDKLYKFLKQNLFLSKKEVDYGKVPFRMF